MNEISGKEEGCRRSQTSTIKAEEELEKKREEMVKFTEVLSETLIIPFPVNLELPQTSVTQNLKLKESEQENCNSSQSPSQLMKKPSLVFAKNILLLNQSGQKPTFKEAKLKVKTFAKDVLIAAHGMMEQTYQDLEDFYG